MWWRATMISSSSHKQMAFLRPLKWFRCTCFGLQCLINNDLFFWAVYSLLTHSETTKASINLLESNGSMIIKTSILKQFGSEILSHPTLKLSNLCHCIQFNLTDFRFFSFLKSHPFFLLYKQVCACTIAQEKVGNLCQWACKKLPFLWTCISNLYESELWIYFDRSDYSTDTRPEYKIV